MAIPRTVWGIDIGQCALKALKLREVDGELQVEAYDLIEHEKILSEPDADRSQLIHTALETFLSRNNVADSVVAVSVPGQSSFSRFVKLPPVEFKRIPDIVRFEAEQQIPFPINDVLWRWQTFQDEDSPDVEVGIFAMKKVDVAESLRHFAEVGINIGVVQMAPLALYNFMKYDEHTAADGATILCDIGADKTDLVVADGARIWTRTIQIGGNNFTEALVRAFKLSFPKAEQHKRTAASSKYARQIFQAMRPVFADLVQEIQRCIGFYTSLHRETRFKQLVGLGNGFRLPGLQKFLEQNLNIPVVRVDQYNKVVPGPNVNAPRFQENTLAFAVSYGLALQALQLTVVNTNLLPDEVARRRIWAAKRPWFVSAAAVLALAFVMPVYRNYRDSSALAGASPALMQAQSVCDELQRLHKDNDALQGKGNDANDVIRRYVRLFSYRDVIPEIHAAINASVAKVTGDDQKLLAQVAECRDRAAREKLLEGISKKKRNDLQIIFLDKLISENVDNTTVFNPVNKIKAAAGAAAGPEMAAVPAAGVKRGFWVVAYARTPLPENVAENSMVTPLRAPELATELNKKMKSCKIEKVVSEFLPKREGTGAPATPPAGAGEPKSPLDVEESDTSFVVGWLISIEPATEK